MTKILLTNGGLTATVENGIWVCDDKTIESMMNTLYCADQIDGYTPDLTGELAHMATEDGWLVEKVLVPPPPFDPNVIY
jgi:hypothetical protein